MVLRVRTFDYCVVVVLFLADYDMNPKIPGVFKYRLSLRAHVHKYGKLLGKGRKFDFAHISMVVRLGYDKNYWVFFCW